MIAHVSLQQRQSHKTQHPRTFPFARTLVFLMTILHPARLLVQSVATSSKAIERVVLVGGGHAHAQVIKALNRKSRPSHTHVTLIDIQASPSYSGMVPGCIARLYTPEETLLHLEPLAEWAGIDFIQDAVVDMDLENCLVYLENSETPIPFDVVSVDIGSASRGLDETPGARQYTVPTRPISELVRRIDEAEQLLKEQAHVVVVGGGAAGVELSMSIMGRWKSLFGDGCLKVTVLNSGTELVPDESPACQRALDQIMKERGIAVRHDCQVEEISKDAISLRGGEKLPYTHCLWAAGAAAHPLARTLRNRGLSVDDRGWIRVNNKLQSLSHPRVFAAGDCSSIEGSATPKAGVYAVRAGPILIDNISNFLGHKPLVKYNPQDDFLKLIVCGDGTALGFRFGIPIHGKWVMQLKDAIDRMFMNLFKKENLPDLEDGAAFDTKQYDAAVEEKQRPRLDEHDAAELLRRTDDHVDYEEAWHVLREMTKDEEYRASVLSHMEEHAAIVR